MRSKLRISPGMLLAFVAVFMIGTASAATAGSLLNGKKIKKGTIPYSALSKDAKKKLAGVPGPQGPAGAGAAKYWAFVQQNGSVGRSSGGITGNFVNNGGNLQYTVTFPTDVSQCGYDVTSGDTIPIGSNEYVVPQFIAVTRSTLGANTLAVTIGNNNYVQIQDSFYITVFC